MPPVYYMMYECLRRNLHCSLEYNDISSPHRSLEEIIDLRVANIFFPNESTLFFLVRICCIAGKSPLTGVVPKNLPIFSGKKEVATPSFSLIWKNSTRE